MEILTNYSGAIIAIVTALALRILEHVLMYRGNLEITIDNALARFEVGHSGTINPRECEPGEKPEAILFECTLYIYNNSYAPRVMRETKLIFYNDRVNLGNCGIYTTNKKITNNNLTTEHIYKPIINVPPKEVVCHEQMAIIFDKYFPKIESYNKIMLSYVDHKNKTKLIELEKVDNIFQTEVQNN
ncbi:MAG: hypothetical protein JJE03_06270 [Peptostreptococcaceae bacterium]|nr:hypothetical protein [Peptostreptococcaceae bacterium]